MSALAILYGYIYTSQYQYTPPWNVKRGVLRETARINTLKQHTIQYEAYKKRIAIIERLAPPEEATKLIKVENDWFEKKYSNPVETIEPLAKNDTVVEEQKNKFEINPLIIIILILAPYEVIFNLFLINILIVKIIQYIKSEE